MAEYDSVIPAGESGKLVAEIRTAPYRARRLSKTISVQTDAEDAHNLTLRFTVNARAPILVKPETRFILYSVKGVEVRERLLLRHGDGEKLEVYSAHADNQFVEAIIEPVVKKGRRGDVEAEPGDVWLELILSADAPFGVQNGNLRLATNHPLAQSFKVRYLTRVRPILEVSPDGVRLWTSGSRDGDGASRFVNLKRNQDGDFKITAIDVSHPKIFSAAALLTDAAQRQTVRVELVEGLTPEAVSGTMEGWVEISTDIPASTTLKVPVLVAPTRAGTNRQFRRRYNVDSSGF